MSRLEEFFNKLRSKRDVVDGSLDNIPQGSSNADIGEIFDRFLDPVNSRQLSRFEKAEIFYACLLDAYSNCSDEYDVDGFLRTFVEDVFILSSSEKGFRSQQLHDIAVGQLNRDFAIEMARIKSGGEKGELKDVL